MYFFFEACIKIRVRDESLSFGMTGESIYPLHRILVQVTIYRNLYENMGLCPCGRGTRGGM